MKKIRPLKDQVRAFERGVIIRTLAQCGGNTMQAASALGVHLATFNRKKNGK